MQNVRLWLSGLPESKKYFELIGAMLTVPVLITVIYLNINNISKEKKVTPNLEVNAEQKEEVVHAKEKQDDPEIIRITQLITPTPEKTTPTPQVTLACEPKIGPIDISFPSENQSVSENPLCITIDYEKGDNCAVVWSYKINESDWSDYDDKSVCVYDLPSGDKTLELRVKSIATGEEKKLTRKFTYTNNKEVTATPTSIISSPTPTPN